MTKIGIVMPVRGCLDYTRAAIGSIRTRYPYEVTVISDRSRDGTNDWLRSQEAVRYEIDPEGSTGLAFNWNRGVYASWDRGCTHFLVANNDILLHPDTIDNLVERMGRGDLVMATGVNVAGACPNPADVLTMAVGEESETEHPDFSLFMITPRTLETVGRFDENFRGAYVEDCDYHARIALAGERAVTYNRAPYYHYASQTIRSDPQIAPEVQMRHAENEDYFRRKWGRSHVGDVPVMREVYYRTPFNDPAKSVREW